MFVVQRWFCFGFVCLLGRKREIGLWRINTDLCGQLGREKELLSAESEHSYSYQTAGKRKSVTIGRK